METISSAADIFQFIVWRQHVQWISI